MIVCGEFVVAVPYPGLPESLLWKLNLNAIYKVTCSLGDSVVLIDNEAYVRSPRRFKTVGDLLTEVES